MPTEIELKLRIAPRDVPRLRTHPVWRKARRLRPHKLYTVYYDTPDLDLWRLQVTLRLRRTGDRWVQTVKGGGSVTAGLHRREEVEAEVRGPLPDLGAIEGSALAQHFAAVQLRAHLRPVVVMEFTRTRALFEPAAGVRIEACIDDGLIKSGDATEVLSELELEMRSGEPWRAYQLALELVERTPMLVEDRSKIERGIALHSKTAMAPVRAGRSPVAASMSAEDAFVALVAACLAQCIANQTGLIEGHDPEYLHQTRVALRRLRSVFGTFAPLLPATALAPPIAEARWLAQTLGPARDWDVFETETLPSIVTCYPGHSAIAAVAQEVRGLRQAANRKARAAVASSRAQGLLLALGGWITARTWREAMTEPTREVFSQPVGEYAHAVLRHAHARVLKRGRHFARLAPEELHRLRVAAKKLRYPVEFFGPLYDGEAVGAYRALLVDLQDELGRYNDAAVMARIVAAMGRGLKGAAAAEARGILMGWSGGARTSLSWSLRRAWQNFRDSQPFW